MPRLDMSLVMLAIVGVASFHVTLLSAAEPSGEESANVKPEGIIIKIPAPEPDVQEAAQSSVEMVYGPRREDNSRKAYHRQDVIGERVRVEGLAWGQPFGPEGMKGTISPHGLPHVIHEGGSIFVKGIDFTETKAKGKPVRVEGILRRVPKSLSRFGDVPGYYYLEAKDFELIDAVEDPYVVFLE